MGMFVLFGDPENELDRREYFIPDYIYFLENKNEQWLTEDHSFTKDPLKAMQFDSEGYAITYMAHYNITDCKVTEHEFVT